MIADNPTSPDAAGGRPAAAPEIPAPDPGWSLVRKILVRFFSLYILFTFLPFPLTEIPGLGWLATPFEAFWNGLVTWTGWVVFKVDANTQPNGSGDTTADYLRVFCTIVLAALATYVWSRLDRKRPHYERLREWLRVYVRFTLALTLIGYGAAKVVPTQFPAPFLDRLLQPFGEASPMGLLWTFMGASAPYTIFSGTVEMLGGLLLTLRRTALLGALVSIAVLTNIVLLNFCYDVPVKLFSSQLLLMALYLAALDGRRLANLLLFNRPVPPAERRPLFASRRLDRAASAVGALLVIAYASYSLYGGYEQNKTYGALAPKPPLYGIWEVERFALDGVERPALVSDDTRWRRVVFDFPGVLSVQDATGARQRFGLKLDETKRKMTITNWTDPKWKGSLVYHRRGKTVLELAGTLDGHPMRAELRRGDESQFLLTSRGFHWINEFPFNR